MTHVSPAERLRSIVLQVGLRDRAEELYPLFVVEQLVGIVDDVAHLVPQIAEDVGMAETLDVPDFLAVQFGQLGPRQVERNADDDRAERDAPFGGQVEARREMRYALVPQFF